FLLLLVPWAIRNYRVTGDVVLLEKYYDDPMGYGTGEIAFRSWWSGWENPRAEEYANAVLRAGQAGRPEEAEAIVQQFVRDLPARARHGEGRHVRLEPRVVGGRGALRARLGGAAAAEGRRHRVSVGARLLLRGDGPLHRGAIPAARVSALLRRPRPPAGRGPAAPGPVSA